jgi:hypothetical protein
VKVQVLIVIVNFKHDGCAVKVEGPEIMFAVRVVRAAEIVKDSDGLYQPLNCFCA